MKNIHDSRTSDCGTNIRHCQRDRTSTNPGEVLVSKQTDTKKGDFFFILINIMLHFNDKNISKNLSCDILFTQSNNIILFKYYDI
jgi:hypothetical protein